MQKHNGVASKFMIWWHLRNRTQSVAHWLLWMVKRENSGSSIFWDPTNMNLSTYKHWQLSIGLLNIITCGFKYTFRVANLNINHASRMLEDIASVTKSWWRPLYHEEVHGLLFVYMILTCWQYWQPLCVSVPTGTQVNSKIGHCMSLPPILYQTNMFLEELKTQEVIIQV